MKSYILCLFAALLAFAGGCTNHEVVVEDHYGQCTDNSQCPGTDKCMDSVCVEQVSQPPQGDCADYEWMATEWSCACQGTNCIGTDQTPWTCNFDVLDSNPSDGLCEIQCHDHFWLSQNDMTINPDSSPASLTIDQGNGVVTCAQYHVAPTVTIDIPDDTITATSAFIVITFSEPVEYHLQVTAPTGFTDHYDGTSDGGGYGYPGAVAEETTLNPDTGYLVYLLAKNKAGVGNFAVVSFRTKPTP